MPNLLKPFAELTVDGSTVNISPLRAIRVQRLLSGSADELRFAMAINAGLDIDQGARVNLDLGWCDKGTTVFQGTIESLEYTLNEVHAIACGAQKDLIQTRIDETFIDQNAGDVVQSLAGKAGVQMGRVDQGIRLAKYHADGSATLFEHLQELARLCGVDVFTDDAGKVNFTKREAFTADYTLQYGINLLDARIRHGKSAVGAIEVVPESAASQEGDEASSWLVKNSRDIAAKEGDGGVRRFSAALCTTKEAAETAAKAYQRDLQRRAVQGKVVIMGQPAACPGQVVELTDMPDSANDGYYEISGVEHALDAIRGFRSTLHLWGQA